MPDSPTVPADAVWVGQVPSTPMLEYRRLHVPGRRDSAGSRIGGAGDDAPLARTIYEVCYAMNSLLPGHVASYLVAPATAVELFEVTQDTAAVNLPNEGTNGESGYALALFQRRAPTASW